MSNLLHLYAQNSWHSDAWVVGDREGLTALRDAINAVLDGPSTIQGATSFAGNGEGYMTVVVLQEKPDVFESLLLPYAEQWNPATGEQDFGDGKHPFETIDIKVYRAVHEKNK